jgi:dienelactone hydrolase
MPATRDAHGRDPIDAFREQAVRLGTQENLVGILTLPGVTKRSGDADTAETPAQGAALPRPDPPAVVVLNAGVLHRVGPHRMHVHLARRLAALGFAGLRLDLAGIGDSLAVAGAQSFRESAVADTRAAMDELTTTVGARRFVIFGLCSGADNALATAAADPRVAGIVVLDPPTYQTRRSQVRKLARRLDALGPRAALSSGFTAARRALRARLTARTGTGDDPPSEGRETPPLAVYRERLHALLERGVKVFLVFSGGLGDRYNHVDQLFEYAPELRGRLDHAYFAGANHMFTERAQQLELLDTVAAWIDRSFR